jgi:lysophospholipase L1-like esterase
MEKRGRLTGTIVLMAVSAALSALLLEGGVLLILGEQVKFPRHVVGASFGLRINEPGSSYRHKSADVEVRFRINNQGMRADRGFSYEKPEGLFRIVSLGDSFTVGYEVEVEETFSSVIERELRALGVPVEVLNAGVSGYSNAEALLYLERELLRYSPDLVLISFFGNDLVDNVRSGLFELEASRLVPNASRYVPAGRLGDFLNRNPILNLLSERSNAFALVKERLTNLAKKRIVRENLEQLGQAETATRTDDQKTSYRRRLAAAIFERIYRMARERGIPLVIQSIPSRRRDPVRLVELFPLSEFDVTRDGVWFFAAKDVLDPLTGRELLYYEFSHSHWTPRSHDVAGRALADLIFSNGLLSGKTRGAP